MTAKEHNKTLGILFLIYLALQILGFVIVIVAMFAVMSVALTANSRDAAPIAFVFGIAIFALLISLVFLIPTLLAGLKMLKEKPNARIWGIIAAVIAILNIPLGTALGVYALWFLFSEEGKNFYLANGNQNMYPPPPQSWQ